ncbi:MAG: CBS domain-containing protein [Anaerolineae bacterium]
MAGLLKSTFVRDLDHDEIAVVILPDSGSRYLSKVFDDEWMRENGFLEAPWGKATVGDLLAGKSPRDVVSVSPLDSVYDAIARMREYDISQMPVISDGRLVGIVTESNLLSYLVLAGNRAEDSIAPIVNRQVTTIGVEAGLENVIGMFTEGSAVVAVDHEQVVGIITKIDLIDYLAAHAK